jgi:hypothetical protein
VLTGTVAAHALPAASSKATLKLSTSTGLPGSSVTFHGTHFRKHEKVALHWSSAKGKTLKTVKASPSGKVSGKFTVPLPNGKVHLKTAVVAVGAKDHKKVKATFRQQCTDAWAATKSGAWSTAKDWSTKVVPGGSDIACITYPRSKSYTVSLTSVSGGATVGELIIGSKAGSRTETLKMVGSGSDMHLDSTAGTVINKRGALVLGVGSPAGNTFLDGGTVKNYGTLANTGVGYSRYYSAPVINEAGGTFSDTVACQNCDAYINANFTNDGTINLGTGATFTTGGITFTQVGGAIHNSGSLILNHGTFVLSKGTATGTPWLLRNGVTMDDVGSATGAFDFEDGGNLNGNVAAGQTIIVDGDAGSDVKLALPAAISNHGTIDLTSDNNYNNEGQTNSMLVPGTDAATTLDNYGLIETTGSGYSRYFYLNLDNEAGGSVVLGDPGPDADNGDRNILGQAQVSGDASSTFTNDGTLTIADGANLILSSSVYGQGDFIQGGAGILNVTEDTTNGTQSLLHQPTCGAGGCTGEFIELAGTVHVTTVGSAASFVPIRTDVSPSTLTGSLTPSGTPAYAVSFNTHLPTNATGDVELTPAG